MKTRAFTCALLFDDEAHTPARAARLSRGTSGADRSTSGAGFRSSGLLDNVRVLTSPGPSAAPRGVDAVATGGGSGPAPAGTARGGAVESEGAARRERRV